MRILLLGFQHGDEPLGEYLIQYIREHRPALLPHVTSMVANPRAKQRGVRYLESDLNRSYDGTTTTYEHRRASEILEHIKQVGYDLVLDLHTTTCNQPPCLISAKSDHPFIAASSYRHVVHMNHPIVHTSLIGACPAAISVEVHKASINDELLAALSGDIERFIAGVPSKTTKDIYEIEGLIKNSELTEPEAMALTNFKKSPQGFYPVLTGENSYKKYTEYLGFKARAPYRSKV